MTYLPPDWSPHHTWTVPPDLISQRVTTTIGYGHGWVCILPFVDRYDYAKVSHHICQQNTLLNYACQNSYWSGWSPYYSDQEEVGLQYHSIVLTHPTSHVIFPLQHRIMHGTTQYICTNRQRCKDALSCSFIAQYTLSISLWSY